MPCYHPIKAYRSTERNPSTGKYGITFNATKALIQGSSIAIPCGQCIGCRLDKAQQWATRIVHEQKLHANSVFLTLTYDQQNVPVSYSLDLRHWQLFMHRLRKRMASRIRFFAVGEYGDLGRRPHYHAIIFGIDFAQKQLVRTEPDGHVYRAPILEELWPMGSHEFGTVTPKSANYCARYAVKKVNGDRASDFYQRVSPIDGNTYNVRPEFAVMSRRPGIGQGWLERFGGDAFPSDFLIIDGQRRKPPAYYLRKLSEDEQKPIKRARKRTAVKQRANSTPARLAIREEIQHLRAKRLLRKLEK